MCCLLSLCLQCPDIRPVCLDLVDWQSAQNAVKSLGHIDLLVNNAGVTELSPFIDVTMDSYDWRVHLPHTSTLINKIPKILFLLTCSVSIERKIFFSRDINQSINIFIRNREQREIEVKKKTSRSPLGGAHLPPTKMFRRLTGSPTHSLLRLTS